MSSWRYTIQSLKYFFRRGILRQNYLLARDSVFDLNMQVLAVDGAARRIYKRGTLYPVHANFILNLPFADHDVVMDLGANIGWYSLVIEKHIKKDIRIYAFEPEPLNYAILKKNLLLNNSSRIVPVNAAVSDRSGQASLFLYDAKNTGRHSLLDINFGPDKTIKVETMRLDDFLTTNRIAFKAVKFVKVDIEGYECIAMKGAAQLLQHLPFMLLEYSPARILKGGDQPAEFIRRLVGFDFHLYTIDTGKPVPLSPDDVINDQRNRNIFLVKKDYDHFKN
jgi:FkbM family methyltransferase